MSSPTDPRTPETSGETSSWSAFTEKPLPPKTLILQACAFHVTTGYDMTCGVCAGLNGFCPSTPSEPTSPVPTSLDDMPEGLCKFVANAREFKWYGPPDLTTDYIVSLADRLESVSSDRERLIRERDAANARIDALEAERDGLYSEMSRKVSERDFKIQALIREKDEAVAQRRLTQADRDQTLRNHEILLNLRRNQMAVNAALQQRCGAMSALVTEAIGWAEEAVDGAELARAIACYRARTEKEGTNG